MKRLLIAAILCLLALSVPGWAQFTERYVAQDAEGGDDGTQEDNAGGGAGPGPWTLAEGLAHTEGVGRRVNIKYNATPYSIGVTTVAQVGDQTGWSVFRGYNTSIGDLEGQGRNADGSINVDTPLDFPTITLTGILRGNTLTLFQNIQFTGALSSELYGNIGDDSQGIVSCRITNTQNNSSAKALRLDNNCVLVNSDFHCTGAAHGIVVEGDADFRLISCRITGIADSTLLDLRGGLIASSTFIGNNVGTGIDQTFAAPLTVMDSTFYNLDEAVRFQNGASSADFPVLINNHATDNGVWLDNQYVGTATKAVLAMNNRTRDNTSPPAGIGDGINVGEVTTDTGGPETDYVNAGAGNLRLISGAPGETAALIEYGDIGAFQLESSAGGTTIIIVED